jgi:hypothetical protein
MCITTIPSNCIVAFPLPTMFTQTRFNVTLHVHHLSCLKRLVPREDLRRSNRTVLSCCSQTFHVHTLVNYKHYCPLGWARCTSVNGHRRFGTSCFFTKIRRGLLLRLSDGLRSFNDRNVFALPLRQKQNFSKIQYFLDSSALEFEFQLYAFVHIQVYIYIYIYISEMSTIVVKWSKVKCSWLKWSEDLSYRVSIIIRRYTDHMKFVVYIFLCFHFVSFYIHIWVNVLYASV